jgi:hypothetical protein
LREPVKDSLEGTKGQNAEQEEKNVRNEDVIKRLIKPWTRGVNSKRVSL